MNRFNYNANITHMYELSFNASTVDFNSILMNGFNVNTIRIPNVCTAL